MSWYFLFLVLSLFLCVLVGWFLYFCVLDYIWCYFFLNLSLFPSSSWFLMGSFFIVCLLLLSFCAGSVFFVFVPFLVGTALVVVRSWRLLSVADGCSGGAQEVLAG